MKKQSNFVIIALGIFLSFASFFSNASYISLSSVNRGWYNSEGESNGASGSSYANYIAGPLRGDDYSNWFAFDLSDISDNHLITSATLIINTASTRTPGTYHTTNVTTDISKLISGTGGLEAFNDLSGGIEYSSTIFSNTDNYIEYSISLNDIAVESLNQALNSLTELWAVGGYYDAAGTAFIFSGSQSYRTTLLLDVTSVPEPGSISVFLCGLLLLGALRYRSEKD
ncbi:hypothetical protein [Vibrio salinus]|uniref:hypothetical protein n=1 Tax=Vibrio salinus TaxID=2899784 RepID=UPI001E292A57|nr:hypothetical protein [Vibrio salinus]MCE0492632.1 hypothetical protein [Vibrio salinus]